MTIATGLRHIPDIAGCLCSACSGTAVCLFHVQTESFAGLAPKKKSEAESSILLCYFFVPGKCVDSLFTFRALRNPGHCSIWACFGVVAVCLRCAADNRQTQAWHLEPVLLAMISACFFRTRGSFLWNAAYPCTLWLTGYLLVLSFGGV